MNWKRGLGIGLTFAGLFITVTHTSITGGAVKTVKGKEMEISLKVPIVAFKGDNVGIARNINGHWRLIGYGEII